jgi:hypothetical protein
MRVQGRQVVWVTLRDKCEDLGSVVLEDAGLWNGVRSAGVSQQGSIAPRIPIGVTTQFA